MLTTDISHFDKVIGIVGGMGPQSGVDLFDRILCLTNAVVDQQHLSTILMSFPSQIVDRTRFLEGETLVNPAFSVVEIIRKLEYAGANIVGIACNTCHVPKIFDVIVEGLHNLNSRVKLMNMPFETCHYIKLNHPGARRIGIMSTNGTYRDGVYKNLLEAHGYEVIVPAAQFQNEIIHRMIYDPLAGIKSNPSSISPLAFQLLSKAVNFFRKKGAEIIVLGCTELSLIFAKQEITDISIVDSTDALARALIREATINSMNVISTLAIEGE